MLSQAGFALVRTTYFATWTLKNIREASENQCYRQVNNLTTEEKIQYIKLVKGNYEHSHLVNPIRNLGIQEWKKLIFADDLLDEETLLVFNQRICAYIQCHSSAQPTKVEIGWVGQDLSEDCVSIYQLMRKTVLLLYKKGIQFVELEADSTDPYALRLLAAFPFYVTETYYTYQERF